MPPASSTATPTCSTVHRVHTNDMVVDQAGNAYVGEIGFHMAKSERQPRPTAIIAIAPARRHGRGRAAGRSLLRNGAVITPDGEDLSSSRRGSLGRRLTAYDIRRRPGALSNQRLFAQARGDGHPRRHLASTPKAASGRPRPSPAPVLRVSPTEGVVERISFDDTRPYACMLGGDDLRDLLYLLRARP